MRIHLLLGVALMGVVLFADATAHAQWTWSPQTGRLINLKRLPKETPELQIEYARSLMIDGKYSKAWKETEKFDKFYMDSDLMDRNQFLRGEIRMAQGKPLDAAKEFQQVISRFPNSSLFDEVIAKQYEIGDQLYAQGARKQQERWAFFKGRPFKRAIEVYGMVLQNQPFSDAAAEAQYKIGLCHHTRDEYTEAAFEYRRVIEDYAMSDWVDDASYGLAKCYYESSFAPSYDQTRSQMTIDAIGNFKERYPADARMEELAGIQSEMRNRIAEQRLQTAQFYEHRRQFHAAYICYSVVRDEFGDTPSAEKARAWLEKNPLNQIEPGVVIPEALRPAS